MAGNGGDRVATASYPQELGRSAVDIAGECRLDRGPAHRFVQQRLYPSVNFPRLQRLAVVAQDPSDSVDDPSLSRLVAFLTTGRRAVDLQIPRNGAAALDLFGEIDNACCLILYDLGEAAQRVAVGAPVPSRSRAALSSAVLPKLHAWPRARSTHCFVWPSCSVRLDRPARWRASFVRFRPPLEVGQRTRRRETNEIRAGCPRP